MANHTYWFDGRQIDEDEAFDERGVLHDGVTTRVKTMMRDGVEVAEGIMMYDEPVPLGYQLVTDVKVARLLMRSAHRYLRITVARVTRLSTIATASAQSMIAILMFKKHT